METMHEGSAQKLQSPPEPHHNPALDGVRGLAILCVLAYHLVYINSNINTPLYIWARALRDSLWCGVDIFFALSGFLITGILVRTLDAPGYFRNFYGRRTLRIFPLYYLVILIVLACTPWLHITWGRQLWRLLTYTNHPFPPLHTTYWSFYFGGNVTFVNFWSLHIEEQFYLIWPFIVYSFRQPRRLLVIAAALSLFSIALRITLAAWGAPYVGLYSSLASRADSLLIGASLALLLYTSVRHRVLQAAPFVLSALLPVLAIIFFMHRGLLWENASLILFSLQFTLISICATALIAVCLDNSSWVSRLFAMPILRFFGKYSYGMYIFHSILPIFYMSAFLSLIAPLAPHPAIQSLLRTLVELATTVAVSVLSFKFVEARFLRLKRYFSYRVPESRVSITESHALS
jgi:peptidoglycan/LPS O-acetylase OafA/YrhL